MSSSKSKIHRPQCATTGCPMSLVDLLENKNRGRNKTFTCPDFSKRNRSQKATEFRICLIGCVHRWQGDGNVTAYIRREFHIVDNLGLLMLIGMDIIGPEGIDCSIVRKELTFTRHKKMTTSIMVDGAITKTSAHSITTMPVRLLLCRSEISSLLAAETVRPPKRRPE